MADMVGKQTESTIGPKCIGHDMLHSTAEERKEYALLNIVYVATMVGSSLIGSCAYNFERRNPLVG